MVGALASAIPNEGGFYVWVRRALGRFWGFQEAWLSLAASVFDMAIYPTLFVLYLSRLAPSWTSGHSGTLWELAIILGCALWNLTSAKAVVQASIALFSVPGAIAVAIGPALLIAFALWAARNERVLGLNALLFAIIMASWEPSSTPQPNSSAALHKPSPNSLNKRGPRPQLSPQPRATLKPSTTSPN